jgi:protein TonB
MFENLELSGSAVGIAFLLLTLLTIGIILAFKSYFKKKSQSNLTETYADKKWSSPLKARTKYPDVDSFSFTGPFLRYGLMAAMAATLFAFAWTQKDPTIYIPDDALALDEEIEVEPPRTAEPPPPPPPPPPPVIEEVPDEEILDEEQPEFEDQSLDAEEEVMVEEKREEAPPPPPPPPPKPPKEDKIFSVVEQMPRFPGCEDMSGSKEEKEACATKKMLEYIYSNLKYPAIARENGIEGQVVIQFVVAKDGSIEDIQLVRDLEGGCGEAAVKIVNGMNSLPQKWTPGKQRGRPVKVKYTLPVKFKLEG